VPNPDGTELCHLDGLFGGHEEFRALSQAMRFRFGEGLPGKAWAARHPVILKEFDSSNFKRAEAAKAIGLTCGVALPVCAGDRLNAVVVFLCGDGAVGAGAMELWHNDPAQFFELRLVDGYYGPAVTFELDARHIGFPRGYGLPGRAWKLNMPLLVKDLQDSKVFLRWKQAVEIGISGGLGIPYPHPSGHMRVMTFLSARDTPFARRFEIWTPDDKEGELVFHSGVCDQRTDLNEAYKSAVIGKGDGTIGSAWLSGMPAVCANLADDASAAGRCAAAVGLNGMVALPFMHDQTVNAVIAWYF
jgi:hypothetical protein